MTRKERRKAAAAARTMNAAVQTVEPETQPSTATPGPLDELREVYLQKFQPSDSIELDLVEEMISAQQRQRSLARIEEIAFAPLLSSSPVELAAAFEKQAKLLASLDRTRKAYAQQFNRALATLTKLRAMKPARKQLSTPGAVAEQSPAPQLHPQTLANETLPPSLDMPPQPQSPTCPLSAEAGPPEYRSAA